MKQIAKKERKSKNEGKTNNFQPYRRNEKSSGSSCRRMESEKRGGRSDRSFCGFWKYFHGKRRADAYCGAVLWRTCSGACSKTVPSDQRKWGKVCDCLCVRKQSLWRYFDRAWGSGGRMRIWGYSGSGCHCRAFYYASICDRQTGQRRWTGIEGICRKNLEEVSRRAE